MGSRKPTFLIICDSRGRGLEQFIDINETNLNTHFNIVIKIRPGRTLEALITELENQPEKERWFWDHAVIAGGICNFTERITDNSTRLLRYNRNEDNIEDIINSIRAAKCKYNNLNFATIPPACLINYFTSHNNQEINSIEKEIHDK